MTDTVKDENSLPLLFATDDDVGEKASTVRSRERDWSSRQTLSRWCGLLLVVFLSINMIMLGVNWKLWRARHLAVSGSYGEPPMFYSPANDVVRYETVDMNYTHKSVFAGKPRPEFEDAWYNLLYYTKIGVTREELRAANITTLKLKGSDKYMAYLEVYHQLHCLKRLVQTRYQGHYASYVANGMLTEEHFDHCVEVIRKGLMCNADTHLHAYAYDTTRPANLASKSSGRRTCVSWDSITAWTRERFVGEDYEIDLEYEEDALGTTY